MQTNDKLIDFKNIQQKTRPPPARSSMYSIPLCRHHHDRSKKMTDSKSKPIHTRRYRSYIFFAVTLLLIFGLLPFLLKHIANHTILPARFSEPEGPLTAGTISKLSYNRLTAERLVANFGHGFRIQIPRVELDYTPASLLCKKIHRATAIHATSSDFPFNAECTARDIRISDSAVSAAITADFPRMSAGRFNAGPIHISTHIEGTDTALSFNVPLQDGLLQAHVQLAADWATRLELNAVAHVPLSGTNGTPVQLSSLVSGIDDLLVSGQAVVKTSKEQTPTVSLQIDSLELPAYNLFVKNLHTDCILHSPVELYSPPGQQLTAERLSVDDLHMDQVRVHYQLEPDSVLRIEDLEARWYNGRISLYNTRIQPQTAPVTAQLICDNLSLEQMLTACGLDSITSGGELSGTLPIRWEKKQLTIENGCLSTPPEHGGTVSIRAVNMTRGILPPQILQAIPFFGPASNTPNGFRYEWITVKLNSEGDNVRVIIEVLGRPIDKMLSPYDENYGNSPTDNLRQGFEIQKPKLFHFNFSVPLTQLLSKTSAGNPN